MANITFQRIGELLRAVFELLWNKPDGLPAKELLLLIPEVIELTPHEKEFSASLNGPRYERIIRLATIPLVKAGWLIKNDKGSWYITEDGRQACKSYPNAQELYKESLKFLERQDQNLSEAIMALELSEELAWEQIWKYLQGITQLEFQQLVADLVHALGYHIGWIAPPHKNRGQIDMIAYTDPIGAKGSRIIVQIKHKSQAITVEGLKAFATLLGQNDYGLLVCSGGMTTEVKEVLTAAPFQKITVFDTKMFFDLWIEYYDRLSREAQDHFPLKKIYFLAP